MEEECDITQNYAEHPNHSTIDFNGKGGGAGQANQVISL
jgi:hypothetical protein